VRDTTRVLTRAVLVFITSTERATIVLTQLISSYDGVNHPAGSVGSKKRLNVTSISESPTVLQTCAEFPHVIIPLALVFFVINNL